MSKNSKNRLIFDPIYGFIKLTNVEWEIIHTPFYQRLRWIKQLGFSCYIFPGAEHSRFGHSIGVLHNAHSILTSIGKAVPDGFLFDDTCMSEEAIFHKSIRLAALMHDLGTFPFSHTTEGAYIKFGETVKNPKGKEREDNHEHLGSFIIKNTDYDNGITKVLIKFGFDPQKISDLVKGVSPSLLANQILHSEIDCDRMDYLLRDAHYTGLKYGSYDRDYLLYHFKVVQIAGHDTLTIKDNALHCVEDFLMSRFAWYSQVIRSPRGARYDSMAEELCGYFLEKELIYRYSDLLDLISNNPEGFYHFNDNYFMSSVHANYTSGKLKKNKKMHQLADMLLFEKAPITLKLDEFEQRILDQDDLARNQKIQKKAWEKIDEIKSLIKKKGSDEDWLVVDVPQKNIVFVKSYKQVIKQNNKQNVLLTRDATKISYENGQVKLLAEVENSIISRLQNSFNFIPNVYCSPTAKNLLEEAGIRSK